MQRLPFNPSFDLKIGLFGDSVSDTNYTIIFEEKPTNYAATLRNLSVDLSSNGT